MTLTIFLSKELSTKGPKLKGRVFQKRSLGTRDLLAVVQTHNSLWQLILRLKSNIKLKSDNSKMKMNTYHLSRNSSIVIVLEVIMMMMIAGDVDEDVVAAATMVCTLLRPAN